MERALRLYNGKPMLNSVNGKEDSLQHVLPLAKKYGAVLVALCLDDSGIPATAAGRIAVAEKIIARAAEYGIESRNIVVDPLALTISTGAENAAIACEVIRTMKARGINTVMGVSNISFGLPGCQQHLLQHGNGSRPFLRHHQSAEQADDGCLLRVSCAGRL